MVSTMRRSEPPSNTIIARGLSRKLEIIWSSDTLASCNDVRPSSSSAPALFLFHSLTTFFALCTAVLLADFSCPVARCIFHFSDTGFSKMLHLFSLCLLARIAYASPAPPAITPSPRSLPELFKRANNVCGSWFDVSSTTHYITYNPTVQCMIALTLTPQNIYCSDFGSPVTTAFDYNDWPVDGCGVGQLCCPSTAPYKTRYDYDETDTSSVQIVCGVGSATLINAYGAPFTLEQTEAQSVGGVNTGAVSDLQPAITVSAVTVTPSASSSSATTDRKSVV